MKAINLGEAIDRKVKMKVVPQLTGRDKYARRGQPKLPRNTVLYCIEYENGGFFTYSYETERQAEMAIAEMIANGTDTQRYKEFNCVKDVDDTRHVMIKN